MRTEWTAAELQQIVDSWPEAKPQAQDAMAEREAFIERAGIFEFCCGMPRAEAERMARAGVFSEFRAALGQEK